MKFLKILLLSPLALLRLFLTVLSSGLISSLGFVWLKLFGPSRGLQRITMSSWGKSVLFSCGVKIDRNELPKYNNYILMPNHRSYLDIFIVSGYTPSAMVAKAELSNWPFFGMAMKVAGVIAVNRKDTRSLIGTMAKIKDSVSRGIPVALFPEGTTYKGPLTKNFKSGSFKIAADSGIPVIPMAIEYRDKNDAWVDDDKFVPHFFRQMGKPITHVTIRYGEPLLDPDHEKLRAATKEQIEKMLIEIQKS
ncbi:MAG: 1-acyl-sn-glycerol-3-phosphate acyltransferase [Bacteroidales bacterium]|nr:1-acyl-sn-glycerol-3-phosphate acyltransferase [Bacteroidales bacterium]